MINPEFDPFIGRMSAQAKLFLAVESAANKHLSKLHAEYTEKHSLSPQQGGDHVGNSSRSRYAIDFLSADEVRIFGIDAQQAKYGSGANAIWLELYNKGNPHTLAADEGIINSIAGIPISSNMYVVSCFPERPPLITNSYEFEKFEDYFRKSKLARGLEYPLTVPTAEDYIELMAEYGQEPCALDENSSQQILEILDKAEFVPNYLFFEEIQPAQD